MMRDDRYYMSLALLLAERAAALGETPVGAVAVWEDGRIVGAGYNLRERGKNALLHAELSAIDSACKTLGGWRLHRCTLYVTLEPCPMCAGAIVNARIARVVFGADDPKAGCFGSACDFNTLPFNHRPIVDRGLMREACAGLLTSFFRQLRQKRTASD